MKLNDWNGWYYQTEPKKKPVGQIVLSVLVFVAFFAVVIDWQWFIKRYHTAQAKSNDIVYPCSEAGQRILDEINTIMRDVERTAKAEILSITDAVLARRKVINLCVKISNGDCGRLSPSSRIKFIMDTYKELYVKTWPKPITGMTPKAWIAQSVKNCNGGVDDFYEIQRQTIAKSNFHREFIGLDMDMEFGPSTPPSFKQSIFVFFWLLKWYYLFGIPILLIILTNMIYTGASIKQGILQKPGVIILACSFGPIGLCFISETASIVSDFNCARGNFLRKKPSDYKLSRQEIDALWVRVFKPELSFAQAYALSENQQITRPVFACFLIWLCGIFLTSGKASFNEPQAVICVQATNETENANCETADFSNSVEKDLAVMPVYFQFEDEKESFSTFAWISIFHRVILNEKCPRGPPGTVGRLATMIAKSNFLPIAELKANQEKIS